jgi:cupin 2 domain-containing protein
MNHETIETLENSSTIRIERIVSNGSASPEGFWHDQAEDEWVFLHQGTATLQYYDGRTVTVNAGDHLLIPAHAKHRVQSVSEDAVWIAVFCENMAG